MYRCKAMRVDDWAPFQEKFEDFFMLAGGDRRLALFIENGPEGVEDVLLIPQHQSDMVELLSPGGWQDCPDARERNWGLLVGHASAREDHGLKSGYE